MELVPVLAGVSHPCPREHYMFSRSRCIQVPAVTGHELDVQRSEENRAVDVVGERPEAWIEREREGQISVHLPGHGTDRAGGDSTIRKEVQAAPVPHPRE